MRRTPNRQTIIKLRAEGLTMTEIGKRYGVTGSAISWAYRHQQKEYIPDGIIPPHVINHWRYDWGWSEAVIRQHVTAYARDIARRGIRQ